MILSHRDDIFLQGSNTTGILLIHGLTGAPAEMKFMAKHLHRKGYTVYVPLLAGHGQDEAALTKTRYEDWVGGLRIALTNFASQVKHVHIAGICVGGGLGLYLAKQQPELVKSVVIYSATLNYDGWNQPKWVSLARFFKHALIRIPKIRKVYFEEKYPFGIKNDRIRQLLMRDGQGIEGTLSKFPIISLYENYRLNDALKNALPSIQIPTLLIHARKDDVSHPRNAFKIQKLHGGKCQIVLLEDSYHMLHVDQERHKVAELTANFFAQTTPNTLENNGLHQNS